MAAIVGIDACVLVAPLGATQFAGGTGGAPASDELPTWNPTAKTWGWSNPHTLLTPNDVSPWTVLPERNEISLSISVDVAEHKPFVANLASAWVDKARTWMNWSGSFSGFYDDADNSIFNNMKGGAALWMVMFDSRYTASDVTPATYWFGKILLTSVDHTTGSEDFSTLDVDFEGLGALCRTAVA